MQQMSTLAVMTDGSCWPEEDYMMPYHAQAVVSETWNRLRAGDDSDGSRIVTNGMLAQALRIPIGDRYIDHQSGGMSIGYLRRRGSEELTWRFWHETL